MGAAVPAPPPPIPPAVPSPEAVASFEGDCEALVVKVDVLNLLEPEVEVDADVEVAVEPELVPHVVDERDESIDDVTLVVPDESWLVKLVVVETEVEEEFVEVRNARYWVSCFGLGHATIWKAAHKLLSLTGHST